MENPDIYLKEEPTTHSHTSNQIFTIYTYIIKPINKALNKKSSIATNSEKKTKQ